MINTLHHSFSPAISALFDDLRRLIGPLYLVGGTVRNMLQNRDFANELNVLVPWPLDECQRRLQQDGSHSVSVSSKLNSLLLPMKGSGKGGVIEIASFRHRQDHPPTIEEDLLHRDLTINAMAYEWPHGPLIDPFHGHEDLAKGRICFVQGVSSLEDDPLRALRFFRFALQLEGKPEASDLVAAERTKINIVPKDKVRAELDRIFSLPLNTPSNQPFFWRFFRSPLLQEILADLTTTLVCTTDETVTQQWKRAVGTIVEMTTPDKEEDTPLLDLRWAALLHEMGKLGGIATEKGAIRSVHYYAAIQEITAILTRFCFSQRRRRRILSLLYHADLNLVPTDRVLVRMMKDNLPLEGLFRLAHARYVANASNQARGINTIRETDNSPNGCHLLPSSRSSLPGTTPLFVAKNEQPKRLLDEQLAKILGRCRALRRSNRQPSPQDLAMTGGEIVDMVRRPQGSWVGEIIQELLEWVSHDPTRNQRHRLQGKIQEWIVRQSSF